MSDTLSTRPQHTSTLRAYVTGFALSLMLTAAAYVSVVNEVLTGTMLIAIITCLAIAQLLVQLVFFLHLQRETKPRLNLMVFSFMLIVVGIIVIGSLWIMHNLDYNMMPHDMNERMLEEYRKGGI
ncbi:MAG: cytochrome o ubiquinol oxidase subunit IV [Candidatus Saccharimonadales bacterium]